MYRVCAAGAFLLALLACSTGCGSNFANSALEPAANSLPAEHQAEKGTSRLNVQLNLSLPCSSKWYADQD